jgi:uncharacterized protein YqjF (DUF2071 family)
MEIDRLSIREPPGGSPLGYQVWDKLLFMHWAVPEEVLRPLIPDRLGIDTFDGRAWIGVTPFSMPGMRLALLPSVPIEPSTLELNVRTYVHFGGLPGVWFFSLDASNVMAVIGARVGFALPYFHARMEMEDRGRDIRFESRRFHPGAKPARFAAHWTRGDALPDAEPGSLDFFLIERYCLYALRSGGLYRARIHHTPWPLQQVDLRSFSSTMIESHGLPTPEGDPLLHGQSAALEVGIWPLKKVADVE